MNLMLASDVHVLESDFEEISLIFDELLELKKKYKITKLIIPGDSFDHLVPTSKELDFFSTFLKKLDIPTILIAANSHESSTHEDSIINHFSILKDTITVCKEYQDEDRLFVGHFILKDSQNNYGGTVDRENLKKFKQVILGHGHNFEVIKNCVQLGSVRRVTFRDDPNAPNKVVICLDYGSEKEKWEFLTLKSPYLMIDIELGKKEEKQAIKLPAKVEIVQPAYSGAKITPINSSIAQLCSKLDKTDPKTKVRIIHKDYSLWREFLPLQQKYKDKFTLYREKKEFLISVDNQAGVKKETINLSESLNSWLEKNNIPEPIKKVLKEEIK